MLFNSMTFLLFFPIVTMLYFLTPHKFRWLLLLTASCFFYMYFIPIYIFVLGLTIIIDYIMGIWIEGSTGNNRKIFLIISIVSTCSVLFIFKYFNFFNANFAAMARFFRFNYPIGILQLILPIGLSFHTFQSLSYVVEVYRGNQKTERNFGIYALYVMFYPQLVAGPIERPQHLLHQFYEKHYFDYKRVTDGLKLMAWGMFKKVAIADRVAIAVNQVYNDPQQYTSAYFIIATVLFAFQIYCDFSGYSDIAIGAANVMGFRLMDNFNRPYSARSTAEFWKRWHISLSTWFRDYLYIPLGGNRVSMNRLYYNLFITFLVSGLWHGANWTYIAWGGLNGFYIIFGIITEKTRKNFVDFIGLSSHPLLHKYIKIFITFLLISFSWIFFRANSISDAFYIVHNVFNWIIDITCSAATFGFVHIADLLKIKYFGLTSLQLFIALACILFMEYVHVLQKHGDVKHLFDNKPIYFRWAMYYFILFGVIFGVFNHTPFIYFQF